MNESLFLDRFTECHVTLLICSIYWQLSFIMQLSPSCCAFLVPKCHALTRLRVLKARSIICTLYASNESTISSSWDKQIWTIHGEFCIANKDLFTHYIKQIMIFFFSFLQWNKCFIQWKIASLNGTFYLSPYANTIAITNTHYLYNVSKFTTVYCYTV